MQKRLRTNRLKVLHITNDYTGSLVYKNLIQELDLLAVEQVVYTPVKEKSNIGKNQIAFQTDNSRLTYSHILNKSIDRLFYRLKIRKILNDIESKIDFSTIDCIHSHTWYSDGGVAYLLHKKYRIPYIVTIRNSDLNVFQKYLIHERPFGRKILEKAKNVVLIAASYKKRVLLEPSLRSIKDDLLRKLRVIPNGVDSFWIRNVVLEPKKKPTGVFNLLYIGKFTKSKNVLALQEAVNEINKRSQVIRLSLVGGGGNAHKEVLEHVKRNPKTMTYEGKIYEFPTLKRHFDTADIFAMPSKQETFGLVYVEAMLQGLPVLYTANEGIDGFYDEKIGEKVLIGDTADIKRKLLKLIENYDSYTVPTEQLIANHDWRKIASTYQNLYSTS